MYQEAWVDVTNDNQAKDRERERDWPRFRRILSAGVDRTKLG